MYPLVILGERYFHYPFLVMKQLVSGIMWVMDLHSLFHFPFSALPTGSKIEDLLTLASQDVELVTDESMEDKGTSFLHEHQKLMLQHFRNTEMAILPNHILQCMILGVSIPCLYFVSIWSFKP